MSSPQQRSKPLLDVRQLEVVYNHVATAVQGVSLEVADGQIVAVIGTNGAGKTTTLRAISGFLPAEDVAITDGSITFESNRWLDACRMTFHGAAWCSCPSATSCSIR